VKWLLLVSLLLAACGGQAPGGQPAGNDALTAVSRVNSGLASQATVVANADPSQQFAQRGREEAAKQLGIPVDQLTIDKVEPAQWRDSSLGCAEAGKAYAQVLTPGIRVVLSGQGQKVEVHGDTSGRMVVCKNPTE
jgi:hypothetical protein